MLVFKTFDFILQGVSLLLGIVFFSVFDAAGYFYWISVGMVIWIGISSILNLFILKNVLIFRKVISAIYAILLLLFFVEYLRGVPFEQINYYYRPLSVFMIIVYISLSLYELIQIKSRNTIDLDF